MKRLCFVFIVLRILICSDKTGIYQYSGNVESLFRAGRRAGCCLVLGSDTGFEVIRNR